jgi:hypothetical protein
MNERSSRSHHLSYTIETAPNHQRERKTAIPAVAMELFGTLNLVDLAGFESVRHTEANGKKEVEWNDQSEG